MVGTRLTLVVSSDTAMYDGWTGGVFLKDENQLLGQLTCGATFPGINAQINIWEEAAFSGCVIATTDATSAGDWVTIDYVATEQGQCTIGLYDDSVSFDDPIATCALIQVKSRDFNLDKIVNLKDFAEFVDTLQTGYYQAAHDLDSNGVVDFYDFEMFIDYWLENT